MSLSAPHPRLPLLHLVHVLAHFSFCDERAKNVFFSFLSNIEEYDSDTMIRLKSKGNIEIYRIALPLFLFQALHLILDGVQGLTPFV